MSRRLISLGVMVVVLAGIGGGFVASSIVKTNIEDKLKSAENFAYQEVSVSWYATQFSVNRVTLQGDLEIDQLIVSNYDWPPTEDTLKQLSKLTVTAHGVHTGKDQAELMQMVSKDNKFDAVLDIGASKDSHVVTDSVLAVSLNADYLHSKMGLHLDGVTLPQLIQSAQEGQASLERLFDEVRYKALTTKAQADVVLLRKLATQALGQDDDKSITLLRDELKSKYAHIGNQQIKQAFDQVFDHFFASKESSFSIIAQKALSNEDMAKLFMALMFSADNPKIANKILEHFTFSNDVEI